MAHNDTENIETVREQVNYFKKVNASLVDGIQKLQGEIEALKILNEMLMNEKQQWSKQKVIQEKVIKEALERSNALNQEHQVEIQRLRDELKNNDYNSNVVVHSND